MKQEALIWVIVEGKLHVNNLSFSLEVLFLYLLYGAHFLSAVQISNRHRHYGICDNTLGVICVIQSLGCRLVGMSAEEHPLNT